MSNGVRRGIIAARVRSTANCQACASFHDVLVGKSGSEQSHNSTLHLGLALWLYPDEPPRADPRLLVCVILLGKLHPQFHATGDELDVSTEWSNIVYLGCEVPVTEITTD